MPSILSQDGAKSKRLVDICVFTENNTVQVSLRCKAILKVRYYYFLKMVSRFIEKSNGRNPSHKLSLCSTPLSCQIRGETIGQSA